jgi:hypothetical protein
MPNTAHNNRVRHEAACAAILRTFGYQPARLLYGGRKKKREKRKEKNEKREIGVKALDKTFIKG